MRKFCELNNINASVSNFLGYKKNPKQAVSSSYKFLFKAPRELFLTKSFYEYYLTLDKDFAQSIVPYNEIIAMRLSVGENKKKLIKEIFNEELFKCS